MGPAAILAHVPFSQVRKTSDHLLPGHRLVEPKDLVVGGTKFKTPKKVEDAFAPVVNGESVGISVGVQGSSRLNSGVVGITESENPTFLGFDVAGIAGVEGIATKSVSGVSGTSDSGPGVTGKSTAGSGVFGVSGSGIGVHGKGGRLAALFEGNVEVTGELKIQGASLAGLLTSIQELTNRVVELEASRVTRFGELTHLPKIRPNITVETAFRDNHGAKFKVAGSGFLPDRTVYWTLWNYMARSVPNARAGRDTQNQGQFQDKWVPISVTRRDGTLSDFLLVDCDEHDSLSFQATDSRGDANDFTGILWSNRVEI